MKVLKSIILTILVAGLSIQAMAKAPLSYVHEGDPGAQWVTILKGTDFQGFLLKLRVKDQKDFEVTLTDEDGHVLHRETNKVGSTYTQKFIMNDLQHGLYTVTVYNEDLYVSQPVLITYSGIELDESKQVRINRPKFSLRGDYLTVAFGNENPSRLRVQFYDTNGDPIFYEAINTQKTPMRLYNLSELAQGTYKVVMTCKEADFTEEITVK